MFLSILEAGMTSALITLILTTILYYFGKKGWAGNLFADVRGGIPRGIGIAVLISLYLFLETPCNYIILVMGVLALFDDILGRKRIKPIPVDLGQLCRGLGMILVIIFAYPIMGLNSILLSLFIQPLNISDMQPGCTCTTVIIMSIIALIISLILNINPINSLILLVVCIAYSPLDYSGKIMMGEVGNHSFAMALGLIFYQVQGFYSLLLSFFIVTLVIAFLRRNNLKIFLENKLGILNPSFGDYFMDVLTGGGLGDLARKFLLRNKKIVVNNNILKKLGLRRLLYNPYY